MHIICQEVKKSIKNAIEEGVEFTFYASPKEVVLDENGRAISVEMVKTVLGAKDESGRQRMEEVKNSEFRVQADIIIMALGFDNDTPSFLAENGIETDKWGAIKVDAQQQSTSAGIYAGGDSVRGADLVVTAAYDGREAARSIVDSLL